MKLLKLAMAAAIALGTIAVPAAAPAAAQDHRGDRDRRDDNWQGNDRRDDRNWRDDRHDNGRHRGWRNGRHRGWGHRRVCRTIWRHHHRQRICRTIRYRR